ncbi:MAG: hypothetical protein SFU83_09515 [Meiothermus sp.]|nr:hypothetical protein [Meiothermus sp.]
MKWLRVVKFVVFWSILSSVSAQSVPTRQLVLDLDSGSTYLNGVPIAFAPPARMEGGRALLPLREAARALRVPTENLRNEVGGGLRMGRLEVYPQVGLARLNGRQLPLAEVGAVVDGTFFVAARALEQSLGLTLAFDGVQRLLTLTYVPGLNARDTSLPVARFATDKREYRLGEPVRLIEYSHDPDGQPILFDYTGLEQAYFTPGPKEITLVVTNRAGRSSLPYTVRINVLPEVMYSPRDFALRHLEVGRTFTDDAVLDYPPLTTYRQDAEIPLIVSNSPEEPDRTGILYADEFSGQARALAYHVNPNPAPARLVVLATNVDTQPLSLRVERLGETASTRVVSVLGQTSLMDFLFSSQRYQLWLEPSRTLVLFSSSSLGQGQGLNLMADLASTGRVQLTFAMVEEELIPAPGSGPDAWPDLLASLAPLDPDGVHIRGTFPSAQRDLKVRMEGNTGRVIIGDGIYDPHMEGLDALTYQPVRLRGNYGVTYRISLEGAAGTVGAFSPRGGMYAGAISVNGRLKPVPENGVLFRPNTPMILFRETHLDTVELELIPASGSFLPINLVVYRLDGAGLAANTR